MQLTWEKVKLLHEFWICVHCDLDIEVRTNPYAMDNNHVRNSFNLCISNSKYNPNWDLNPGLFCFQKCSTIDLFGCFCVFDS